MPYVLRKPLTGLAGGSAFKGDDMDKPEKFMFIDFSYKIAKQQIKRQEWALKQPAKPEKESET